MTTFRCRRNAAPGGPRDSRIRRITTILAHPWPGPRRPVLYAANPNHEPPDVDEITGIVRPPSTMRGDAFGRTTKARTASRPSEEEWLL